MKLTAKIKLEPSAAQRKLLHETLIQANAACNAISASGLGAVGI